MRKCEYVGTQVNATTPICGGPRMPNNCMGFHMATSRLIAFIEVVEGGPRADELDLGGNPKIDERMNITEIQNII